MDIPGPHHPSIREPDVPSKLGDWAIRQIQIEGILQTAVTELEKSRDSSRIGTLRGHGNEDAIFGCILDEKKNKIKCTT